MRILNPQLTLDWLKNHCTGKGVRVAVVDSGVDAAHPDLAGKVEKACMVRRGEDGEIDLQEQPGHESADSYGHGTAVAGAVMSVAPDAQIVSVKVLNEYNQCTGHELIAGFQWALDQRIRLINMSLATARQQYVESLHALCEQAYLQDAIVVASKRNFGDIGWPARFLSIVSIDREDFDDAWRLNYMPHNLVEFAAHGTNVRLPTLNQQYALQTGTSFATPHVTGIVALLLEAFPDLLPWEAKTILRGLCGPSVTTS
jgi:subtilisin family serine protease